VHRIPIARSIYYNVYSRISHTLLDVATPFGPLTVDLADRSVGQKLFLGRNYERRECEILARFLRPGMVFFDVGAHVGYYTLLASRKVGAEGRVVAFEPDPRNHQLLTENVRINELSNVEVVNTAVGSSERTLELFRDPDWTGDHRIHAVAGRDSVTVRCTSLDAFCAGKTRPDIIKMDVQGAEGEVLSGMSRLITEAPPRAIFTEFWPSELAQVGTGPERFVEAIQAAGYAAYEVSDRGVSGVDDAGALARSLPGAEDYTNLLFVQHAHVPQWLT
jgi:FkbM family methyltransferase